MLTKAAEGLFEERTLSDTEWQDWHGSDAAAHKQLWRKKLKVRAPSTLERPAVEAPTRELPAKAEPAEAEKGKDKPAGGCSRDVRCG